MGGIGIGISSDFGSSNFTVFSLEIHTHLGEPEVECLFRYGINIGIIGIHFIIGYFQH